MLNPLTDLREPLVTTTCEKDIGVYVDSELTFSKHTITQVNKANKLVGMIRRNFYQSRQVLFQEFICFDCLSTLRIW